ncbi:hypothetical protein L7F22_018978 [Adiantum nelumboides]|nr:hypothetical protein [Adiantum nelumboides]
MTAAEARSAALQLSNERRTIDEELSNLFNVLRSQNATMNSALIDNQGFPIASIDIVAVRTARARIIALRNDRENVENRMRGLLDLALSRTESETEVLPTTNGFVEHHDDRQQQQQHSSTQAMANVPGTNGALSMSVPIQQDGDASVWSEVGGLTPFAKVNAISPNSPAQQADMRVGDEILQFATLTGANAHRSLANKDLEICQVLFKEEQRLE